jgi:hypothetical protein
MSHSLLDDSEMRAFLQLHGTKTVTHTALCECIDQVTDGLLGVVKHQRAVITALEKTTLKAATTWEPGKTFAVNDTIQRDGSLWQCVESHGPSEAFNHAYWKLLIKRGKDGRDLRDLR